MAGAMHTPNPQTCFPFSGRLPSVASLVIATGLLVCLRPQHLPAEEATAEPQITAAERSHWAFSPLKRPAVPSLRNVDVSLTDWPRNAIDYFILNRLAETQLQPMPATDRVALIRRLTFDLTGLPPTIEEIDAFLKDASADADQRLIERLLASPAYGERWAQHWLDLARFAETDGFEHDRLRPDAWKYRDWVIDALNDDLPFDAFARRQLAGDEIGSEHRIATGFLTCGPDMPDINLQDERRHSFLNDMTSTVSSVFLGLQIGCAQCHDHKFDPMSQLDFYRLRAFFDPAFPTLDRNKTVALPLSNNRTTSSHLMIRGDFRRTGPAVEPAFVRIGNPAGDQPDVSENRTNLRSELARWLTRPDHPLTTRTLANRLWHYHFGTGLSETPSDFGFGGDGPAYPQLLDWLATEIPRRGWSLKAMHRLIVSSATWRQTSRLPDGSTEKLADRWQQSLNRDPQNRLHSRGQRRRLEGEAIRDAMLAASGALSQRRRGPGIRPPLPEELVRTLLSNQWPVSENPADFARRSVYLFVRRNLRYPLFDVFDKPDTNASCARRNESTIAPQALMLLNSEQSLEAAVALAESVRRDVGNDRVALQIEAVFRRALARRPSAEELQILSDSVRQAAVTETNPLVHVCLAVFNMNEFIYLD